MAIDISVHLTDEQIAAIIRERYVQAGITNPPEIKVSSFFLDQELVADASLREAKIRETFPAEIIAQVAITDFLKRFSVPNDISFAVGETAEDIKSVHYIFSRADKTAPFARRLSENSGIPNGDIKVPVGEEGLAQFDNLLLLHNAFKGMKFGTTVNRYTWPQQVLAASRLDAVEFFLKNGGNPKVAELYTHCLAADSLVRGSSKSAVRLYGFMHPLTIGQILDVLRTETGQIANAGSPPIAGHTLSFARIAGGLSELHDRLHNQCGDVAIDRLKIFQRLVYDSASDSEGNRISQTSAEDIFLTLRMLITHHACQALRGLMGDNLNRYAPERARGSVAQLQRKLQAGLM